MNTPIASRDPRVDELLIIRCQLGERAAFDALIARWHEPLWRYLRRLSNNDDVARDFTQDTWLRVLRAVATLRDAAKFRAWLFGIARRVAMDRLRALYAQAPHCDVSVDDIAAEAPDVNLETEFATLESSVASLAIVERETVTLFYLRELSLEEIAELTGVPVGTVKSRLFRARRQLRDAIEQPGSQP